MRKEMQGSNVVRSESGARIKEERHENGPVGGSPESSSSNNKEQDRFLPIANVGRIMKKVIPSSGKISKDAKESVQECVSEFISFVTGEASDKCQREKRKTINGDDIIWAITTLGFEDYVGPLKVYLTKYRELEGEKMNIPKQQPQPRMHPHLQRPDQMPMFGGGYPSPVGGVFSSHRTLLAHQPPYVATDQPFSPRTSLQKPYHHHTDQIDSVAHW